MRLILLLCAMVCVQGTFVSLNTLVPGSIVDGRFLIISEFHGYFWDDPNMGGTNFQQAGRINGGSTAVPYLTNNAGKSVVELFGRQQNIDRFCFTQHYFRNIGKSTDDWTFEFNAVILFQGFQEFDLVFYDDVEKEHIVTFEHRAISSAIRLGMLNRFSWDRHEFENPSGFDSLVSKLTNGISVKFYLEFKNLHITVPTTIPSTTAAPTSTTAAQTTTAAAPTSTTAAQTTTAAVLTSSAALTSTTAAPTTTAAPSTTSAPVTTVAPANEKSSVVEETVEPEILDENLLTVDSYQETNVPMDKTWVYYIFLTAGFIAIIIVFVIAIYAVRRFRRNFVHHSNDVDIEVVII